MEKNKLTPEERKEKDAELLRRLCVLAVELGHLPTRDEVPFAYELKGRFGPWPRVLEAAGLKEVGARYQRKQQKKEARRRKRRRRSRNKVVQETLPSQQEDGKEEL